MMLIVKNQEGGTIFAQGVRSRKEAIKTYLNEAYDKSGNPYLGYFNSKVYIEYKSGKIERIYPNLY